MSPRIEHFLSGLRALASSAVFGPIDPVIDPVLAQARPERVQVELLRFRGRGSKLVLAAHGGVLPTLAPREGFTLRETPQSVTLSRDDEYVVVIAGEAVTEWHADVPAIDEALVHAFLASFAPLTPFEALARPPAFIRKIGNELPREGPLRALLAVDLAPGRMEEDEAALASRGFGASSEDAIWVAPGGHSLAWAGGTAYGYLGEVPEYVGGW